MKTSQDISRVRVRFSLGVTEPVGSIKTKRHYQCCDNSAMVTVILFSLKTMQSLQIATHLQVTPLFSVSLASRQSYRSINTNAWCKRALRRRKTEEWRRIEKEYRRWRYVTYHHAEGDGPRTCCPNATSSAPAYWTPPPPPLGSTAPPTSGAPPCSPCSSRPPGRLLDHHPVRRARRTNRTSDNEDSVVVDVVLLDVSVVVVVWLSRRRLSWTRITQQEQNRKQRSTRENNTMQIITRDYTRSQNNINTLYAVAEPELLSAQSWCDGSAAAVSSD